MLKSIANFRPARALCIAALLACAAAVPAVAQEALAPAPVMKTSTATVTSIGTKAVTNSVTFSGEVKLASRLARDPELGNHKVLLTIDLSGLSAVKNKVTFRTAYREEFIKPLAANHRIDFMFPVTVESETTLSQVIMAQASIALNVDPASGDITSATATVTAP
jgi:hypothetical protein